MYRFYMYWHLTRYFSSFICRSITSGHSLNGLCSCSWQHIQQQGFMQPLHWAFLAPQMIREGGESITWNWCNWQSLWINVSINLIKIIFNFWSQPTRVAYEQKPQKEEVKRLRGAHCGHVNSFFHGGGPAVHHTVSPWKCLGLAPLLAIHRWLCAGIWAKVKWFPRWIRYL